MNPTAGYRHLTSTGDKLVCCAVSYALLKFMGGGGNCLCICALCVLIVACSTYLVELNTSFNKHFLSYSLQVRASHEVLPKEQYVNTPDIWFLGKNNFLIRSVCQDFTPWRFVRSFSSAGKRSYPIVFRTQNTLV
jgi:hypothetical protein